MFAAGVSRGAWLTRTHLALMSCQRALSMGRAVGRNVARDLLGLGWRLHATELRHMLDLGAWGAVFTRGWDRTVQMTGAEAKALKRQINSARIYPPRGEREQILGGCRAAAAAGSDAMSLGRTGNLFARPGPIRTEGSAAPRRARARAHTHTHTHTHRSIHARAT